MELMLQFGYGMMDHCRTLCRQWGGGSVLLSPRDLEPEQMERFSGNLIAKHNGQVLLDPQFYLPHADHERLTSHSYWPDSYSTGAFWTGPQLANMLAELDKLNGRLGARATILPGLLAPSIDDDWLAVHAQVASEARRLLPTRELLSTIALNADALRSTAQVETLLEGAEHWPTDGIYLVAEHPSSAYLVEDPIWLGNALDIVAHFRLAGKRVVVGYCTHQMLLLATAGCRELASGTWMNVRSFPPGKFAAALDDEIRLRTTWYLCPQALSEYKLPFVDIAWRQGVLDQMRPDPALGSGYADPLFSGPQPSTTDFDEPAAFRHYLQCFHSLARQSRLDSFEATVAHHSAVLDAAERLCATLSSAGVVGQLRDFSRAIDANRAAVAYLVSTRGPQLRRSWKRI